MKKRFEICIMLLLIIFLMFITIKETSEKYRIKNNIMKNYEYNIANF